MERLSCRRVVYGTAPAPLLAAARDGQVADRGQGERAALTVWRLTSDTL